MSGSKAVRKLVRVVSSSEAGFEEAWEGVCLRDRPEVDSCLVEEAISCLESVGDSQDKALYKWLEGVCEQVPESLEVTPEEWDAGCEAVDPSDRAALGKSAMRIREFHRKRIPGSWEVREEGGGYMGQRVRPLTRVGVYMASDRVFGPSDVIMYATPASAVEVPEISLAVAPDADGRIRPEILMAARVSGVHRIFKLAGMPAIAAFALGTSEVPKVEKLVGPGGIESDIVRQRLAGEVGIVANTVSTELCIVADRTATPDWLVADLLAQAQVGDSARALVITHCKALPARIEDHLGKHLSGQSGVRKLKQRLASGFAVVVTRNLAESLELADRYAPEHLVAAVEKPEAVLKGVHNAGAVLMGHYTPAAVGNSLAGPGSVLPSGGSARFASPLCVWDFLKRTNFVKFEPPKLRELGPEAIRLAEIDGMAARGASVELRLKRIRRARREREVAREAEL